MDYEEEGFDEARAASAEGGLEPEEDEEEEVIRKTGEEEDIDEDFD